ncbi:hypothetical protein [Dyadobacter pollutisoli]|uniref:Uncharacterized protein n=1 Tax=Dyadobacter pollutisoli TaxID=2910158 RepID=A0A9E8N7D9_9BACT|nr:hypothetical protein [Dyadobacter pollutisoli]WAC09921.1 hypothetical protein ON006_19430 [Dyadobacter pollutisoli]
MKKLLTILLAGVSTLAIAQKRNHLSRSIDDDGKTLSIRVTGTIDGKEINYDKSFNVEELSSEERMALRDKVLDSIEAGNMDLPEPPKPRSAPKPVPGVEHVKSSPEPVVYSSNGSNSVMMIHKDPNEDLTESTDPKGFTKHVRYNPDSGEMFLKYRFMKNNEEYIYEKTVDASDKSESERQRIIEKFENEIELPGKGIEM